MPKEGAIIELYNQVQMNKTNSPIYKRLNRNCIEQRENFEKELTERQKEELEQLLRAREDRDEQEVQEYFIDGFKIAIQIMTEVFYKEEK